MPDWLQITLMLYICGVMFNIMSPTTYHFMKKEWKAGVFDHTVDVHHVQLSARSRRKLWLIRLGSFPVQAYLLIEVIFLLFWETRRSLDRKVG
jgi:hypothetical protein